MAHRPRIAIDLTALMPQTSGVDVYLAQLVLHLGKVDPDGDYHVFINREDRARFEARLTGNVAMHALCPRPRPARLVFQQAALPLLCTSLEIDVLHSPSFLMPVLRGRPRHVVTVHDMTFFSMPEVHNRLHRSWAFRSAVMMSIRRAELINVPSTITRNAVLEWAPEVEPERVVVTPFGVGDQFAPATPEAIEQERARLGLPERFILHLGTIEPRKNVRQLVAAFRELVLSDQTDVDLVLVGRLGWSNESLLRDLAAPELAGRVHLLGFVEEADLPWILRAAEMLVYPSLYEGFGFPPLEAMACGTPVVTTKGSAVEENVDDAALLVEPRDTEALTEAIGRVLDDRTLADDLRERGLAQAAQFRWSTLAQSMVECYERVS